MTELSDRVSRLEGAYEHLVTKADIAELKGDIAELKGDIAHQVNRAIVVLIAAIGAAVALVKYLPG